jgi:hypothetical protein
MKQVHIALFSIRKKPGIRDAARLSSHDWGWTEELCFSPSLSTWPLAVNTRTTEVAAGESRYLASLAFIPIHQINEINSVLHCYVSKKLILTPLDLQNADVQYNRWSPLASPGIYFTRYMAIVSQWNKVIFSLENTKLNKINLLL